MSYEFLLWVGGGGGGVGISIVFALVCGRWWRDEPPSALSGVLLTLHSSELHLIKSDNEKKMNKKTVKTQKKKTIKANKKINIHLKIILLSFILN